MSVTPTDKAQKTSAAAGLGMVVILAIIIAFGSIKGCFDQRAKDQELAGVLDEIERVEASSDAPSTKSKKWLELAYSDWDVSNAVDAKYSQNFTLNRVGQHVQAGYNVTDPLSPAIFDKAAEATCLIRVRQVNERSATFESDNFKAYQAAKYDLEAWRQYLANYDKVWDSCAYRFQFMRNRYVKRLEKEKEKSVTMRDIGATVGEASSKVGEWWDSATKSLSDAVDEFKAGYQSGK
ncbi:hypothetical protein U8C31_27425 (plasmid) [Sinorhizobium medicae]|uniref:hypothetical protein n=1 Tax=Sinorhizobium medicae TaxID=110321 RepID=UPI002AF6B3F7|nr:hypothetical protein [Sinorhizobium medicae]WQO48435.1 hypothetical protein U8C42_26545 [Sinorhizobium medicae]WQO75883.1 hypothetical protein U8C31_27425 [Sinorhizobium medicae]